MKIGLIRNPHSGRGAGARSWPEVERRLRDALPDRSILIEETTAPGSAREQAAKLARDGCEIVIGAGGDGTVSDVMQGILGTEATLAILPLGTGNDFVRTLGIGPNVDLAIEAIVAGQVERIDVGQWRQDGRVGHFMNVAGCGFDAAVADRVNKGIRFLSGQPAYLAAVFGTLCVYRPTKLRIVADGEEIARSAMLCAIANARTYGGGMQIAPQAELRDGLLDLVLVGELGRMEFCANFGKVLKGTHLSHPKVLHRTFKELTIESDPPAPFIVDGELLPPGRLEVSVRPAALKLIVP